MAKVLVIDDDEEMCYTISALVKKLGHDVASVHSFREGQGQIATNDFDVVFLDVVLPDGNGLDLLPLIKNTDASAETIILTGQGDMAGAEQAIKNGAWDYIQKPVSIKEMSAQLSRAIQYREKKAAKGSVKVLNREQIIGNSDRINDCLELLAEASNTEANVLISGETGTGKELFAWALHKNSSRGEESFVVVDCAALPEPLLESTLFGHVKGAFTGAVKAQEGLIKQAHKGTLFLDEIGELAMPLQKAFLRVLQERRFRPLGSKEEIESDFRLVAATNRNLEELAASGQFRKDLLFRIKSITIELPPLKQRGEDIKAITLYKVARLCEQYGIETKGFSSDFFEALYAYDWPGNVRELISAMEWAISSARHEPVLFPRHLPTNIRIKLAQAALVQKEVSTANQHEIFPSAEHLLEFRDFIKEAKRRYFHTLMSLAGENIGEACKISKISRSSLYEHLKKYAGTITQER